MKRSVNFNAPRRYYQTWLARQRAMRRMFRITCATCRRVAVSRAQTKEEAGAEFLAAGWTTAGVCPACAARATNP
jgi:hypothetical protein